MELSDKSKLLELKYNYITSDPEYKKLYYILRHSFTNTYDHSVRVAACSIVIAKKLGMDPGLVARPALLHDFCLEDYHDKNPLDNGKYALRHPKVAVLNSRRFGLSRAEEKAILSHMFPLGPIPTNKIGWIVCTSDKIVTAYEKSYGIRSVGAFLSHAGIVVTQKALSVVHRSKSS